MCSSTNACYCNQKAAYITRRACGNYIYVYSAGLTRSKQRFDLAVQQLCMLHDMAVSHDTAPTVLCLQVHSLAAWSLDYSPDSTPYLPPPSSTQTAYTSHVQWWRILQRQGASILECVPTGSNSCQWVTGCLYLSGTLASGCPRAPAPQSSWLAQALAWRPSEAFCRSGLLCANQVLQACW